MSFFNSSSVVKASLLSSTLAALLFTTGCDYGNNVKKIKELATIFTNLLEIKKELSEKDEPGILDPCIGNSFQCNGDAIFTPVFHCMSIGN